MDKFLPGSQGKRDILILVLIAVPLILAGFVWAMLEGGYAEPVVPATPISSPAPSPAASPTFIATPGN